MRYSLEADLIWENYLSPKEGGLPMQADVAASGGPFNTPGQREEGCEEVEKLQQGENQEIKMAQADLLAIKKQVDALMQQLQDAQTIPGWVQSKITIANQYITDVAQYMDFESQKCDCDDASTGVAVIRMTAM